MSCDITAGRLRQSKQSQGGASKLFLFNYVENPFTVVNGVATAINPLLTEVFEYEIEGDGNKWDESLVGDENSGTAVNTQTGTIILKKIDAVTSHQLNLLCYSKPQAVLKDRNGIYHAIGVDDGIMFTVAQSTGGTKQELNGYTLTGVSTTDSLSPKLDANTAIAFLALV